MQLALLGIGENQAEKAIEDIWSGLHAWRLWTLFGFNDVRMRYRRSTLGPFWASLSMGIQVLVTGFVMAFLFNVPLQRYLPFICIGLIVWNSFMTIVTEGATAFISSSELILQIKRPIFVYLLQVVWRNIIVGAHTIVIFFIVAFLFGVFPGPTYLLAIPGPRAFPAQRRVDGRRRRHPIDTLPRHSADHHQRIYGAVLAHPGGLRDRSAQRPDEEADFVQSAVPRLGGVSRAAVARSSRQR